MQPTSRRLRQRSEGIGCFLPREGSYGLLGAGFGGVVPGPGFSLEGAGSPAEGGALSPAGGWTEDEEALGPGWLPSAGGVVAEEEEEEEGEEVPEGGGSGVGGAPSSSAASASGPSGDSFFVSVWGWG
ncbi:hypothetical protein MAMC_00866 [Methylacidimicrobium cyclopophantes]|uniref:Uncharacterized protein n=1 Tax=Methylacidimicrobium cyclopophantes TaxID=1041766 RepID=A0A5E6M8Q1_9BACT|nr:hypothetical protein [Methylacidimicrobium cyclopophantes]VVM05941.1 hypothetical protein MAMC_00866 [Methylacidimicrobium cyclopophantes]